MKVGEKSNKLSRGVSSRLFNESRVKVFLRRSLAPEKVSNV
jgi:hypothetical protein